MTTLEALEEADRLRESAPEEAVACYLGAPPELVLADHDRVEWLLENLGPVPPEAAMPLLTAALEGASPALQPAVLHALGVVHWYRGETMLAEDRWRGSLEASREKRDRSWLRSHNNLALCLSHRGAYFEALVLFGGAARLAAEMGVIGSRVFALCRRGQMLALLGDHQRASRAYDAADALWPAVESESERHWLESTLLSARARLHRVTGDWRGLLDAQERRIAVLGELPPQQHATLADAHTQRLRALAELEPERGGEWIAELEALPERYELDEDWERQLVRELARLRYRMAQQASVESEALRARAESLLDAILDSVRGNERVHELVTLGRSFESVELRDLSRRAFDQAATEILRRLAEAAAAKDDLPELQGATEEDWQIHEESQQRLFTEQRELMDTVAELWRPGHPAFELIVVDDLVRLCAWCRRLQRRDGEWIPASGYVPSTPAVSVSHGICEGCREAHFSAVGG